MDRDGYLPSVLVMLCDAASVAVAGVPGAAADAACPENENFAYLVLPA